ncbi:hypothetical protein [Aeromicrobium sp. 179-A 4D2 NHS]
MSGDEFEAWLRESCARQGVPLRVVDEEALDSVRALLNADLGRG